MVCRSLFFGQRTNKILLNQMCRFQACLPNRPPSWRSERSQRWKRGVEERSTLTARASHIIEAGGTLGFDNLFIKELQPTYAFGLRCRNVKPMKLLNNRHFFDKQIVPIESK
jgi:hypothetical protein